MKIAAKVIADSVSQEGVRIVTVDTHYPRFALAELNTHRVFTRNGASSRAIPFATMMQSIIDETARPMQWLKNQPGMQAFEAMSGAEADECDIIWNRARDAAIFHATLLAEKGASKQYVNRIIEPYMMTRTLITSTKWANFYKLRDHKDALPEFAHLARLIKTAVDQSEPVLRKENDSNDLARWHLPYITNEVRDTAPFEDYLGQIPDAIHEGLANAPWFKDWMKPLLIMSAARCARLSYRLFDGKEPTFEDDLKIFTKLWSDPLHASPLEHQATPSNVKSTYPNKTGNFHGWRQLRKYLPDEAAKDDAYASNAS